MMILTERTEERVLQTRRQRVTFDSQLLYRMGRLMAFSLSMLGKCFKATISGTAISPAPLLVPDESAEEKTEVT